MAIGMTLMAKIIALLALWAQTAVSVSAPPDPAIAFQTFNYPSRAVVDEPRQIMYVTDYGHDRIVKLDMRTRLQINEFRLVDPPLNYPVDITVTFDGQSLYACDPTNHRIVHLNSSNGQLIRQFTAPINETYTPQGIIVDNITNHIIFTDFWRGSIIILASDGTQLNVIQSTNASAPYYPMGITMDRNRKLYVADSLNYRIMRLDLNGTLISHFNVSIPPQELGGPESVALDEAGGFIYYSDAGSNRVIKCSMDGKELSAVNVGFRTPNYLSVHSGILYIADGYGNRIILVNRAGQVAGVYTPPGANLDTPIFVAVDGVGRYYVADSSNNRVVQLSSNGTWINSFTLSNPSISQPRGIAIEPITNNIYIADSYNKRIIKLSPQGSLLLNFTVPLIYYKKFSPQGISLDPSNGSKILYIADDTNIGFFKFTTDGLFIDFFNSSIYLQQPNGITVGELGNIYITDIISLGIIKFNSNGTELNFFNISITPRFFAFDIIVNNQGDLYVTDCVHNDIIKLGPKGHVIGTLNSAGNNNVGAMSYPVGIDIDPTNGHIVVIDQYNTRLVIFTSPTTTTTIQTDQQENNHAEIININAAAAAA